MNDECYKYDLSIVIIGKNADWSIGRLLNSIMLNTPAQATSEIIYVDSASTDRTLEIVRGYPVKIVKLSSSYPLCASAGRFIGSQYATGKYIAFFDSDMELAGGWLQLAMRTMDEQEKIGVVSGIILDAERTAESGLPKEAPSYLGNCLTDIRYAGNAAMFRHEVLIAAGNWNPYLISDEEPELCLRIRHMGFRVVQLSLPVSCHYTYPFSEISTLLSRRKRRLFLGYGQVLRYHLRTGLLLTYFLERGWAILPAVACVAAIGVAIAFIATHNPLWLVGYGGVMLLVLAADAVRSRSLYKVVFHVLHRALILEGTIRGFAMTPQRSDDYPRDVQVMDPGSSSCLKAEVSV